MAPDDDLADVAPEEFVAARDALAKQLKADGRDDDAAAVKKLRKPTVTAWITGQVRRHRADAVGALRGAAAAVAQAQETAITGQDREPLRAATAEHATALARVEQAVDETLAAHGRPAHHRDDVLRDLEAGVVADLGTGTFGVRDDLELPERVRSERSATPKRDRMADRRRETARATIAAAQSRIDKARDDLEKAETALAEVTERYADVDLTDD